MAGSKNTIGFTANTLKNLLVDAGAIYKDYNLPTEALIGATSNGNEFDITPKTYDVKVDGLKGSVKGLTQIISTDVTLKVNMLEITTDTLKMALMADVDTTSDANYDIITGRTTILDTDYIENIALVGKISGSANPIVIILKNALSSTGIKFSNKDSSSNVLPITFTANIDPNAPADSVFEIHYPKVSAVAFTVIGTPIIDNGKVLIDFSDTVGTTPPLDGFIVTINGVADAVTASTRGINDISTILLTLTTVPTSGQVVTVAYTKPTLDASDVKSLSGVALDTFTALTVTNN